MGEPLGRYGSGIPGFVPEGAPPDLYTGQSIAPQLPLGPADGSGQERAALGLPPYTPEQMADPAPPIPGAPQTMARALPPGPQAQPAGPALMRPRAEPRPTVPYPLALQYGGRYGLSPEEYTAEQARLIREGKLDPGQMLEGVQQYDRYSRSPWGLGAQIERSGVAGDMERGAIDADMLRRQADDIDRQRAAFAQYERDAAAAEQQRREVQQRKEAAVSRAMARYSGAVERLDNSGVDPDRWWKERGTGGGILAAIAVGLGALGSTWGKTPNYALDIIQSSIDRDIDAQKATLENKRSALAARQTLVGQLYDYYGDMEQATQAARSYAYSRVAGQVQQIGLGTQRAGVQAQAAQLSSALQQSARDSENKLKLQAAMAEEQAIAAQQQAAAAAAQAQASQRSKLAENEVVPGATEVYSPTLRGLVKFSSASDAAAARNRIAASQLIRDTSGDIVQSIKDGEKWTAEGRGRAELAMRRMKDELKMLGYAETADGLPDVNRLVSPSGVVMPGAKEAYYKAVEGTARALELSATSGRQVIPGSPGRLVRDAQTGQAVRAFVPAEPISDVQIRGGKGGGRRGGSGESGGGADVEAAVDEAMPDKGDAQ